MNPVLAIGIIELAIKAAPSVVAELRLLFSKGDPTPEDWEALRVKVQKSYDDYIREAMPPAPASTSPVPPS
jgi:hypothetical protein